MGRSHRQSLSGSRDLESLSPQVPKGSEETQCPCLSQLFKARPRLLLELPPELSLTGKDAIEKQRKGLGRRGELVFAGVCVGGWILCYPARYHT